MIKNKSTIIFITCIFLIICLVLVFLIINLNSAKNGFEVELIKSHNYIGILLVKIDELLDEINDLKINYGALNVSETALSLYTDRIVGLTNLNWFIPDFIPLKNDFAISRDFSAAHQAVDFSTSLGRNVYAAGTGIVILSYQDRYLGNVLLIDHLNSYKSLYAHMDSFLVSLNEFVEKGQAIGTVGNTGNSTNPHLHLEIYRDNNSIDPNTLMDISKFWN